MRRRNNHLAARVGAGQRLALPELDADRALAIEAHALDLRVRQHPQVGALRGGLRNAVAVDKRTPRRCVT
jgi:hypothetical protein